MATASPSLTSAALLHYDAFISYSHNDRGWVDTNLLPPLKQNNLRVCIDKDFELGAMAQENMENAINSSRHVVLVLSPSFVKGDWTAFEYLFAAGRDPSGRRHKLVPLLIEKCDLPQRYSMMTYADFCDPANYETEIKRVISAIGDHAQAYVPPAAVVARP